MDNISLPPEFVLRKAEAQDCWRLQKLNWQFEIEEVLGLDLRVVGYQFLIIFGLALGLAGQIYLCFKSPLIISILILSILYTSYRIFLAIISLLEICLNIIFGAILNWSKFWIIEHNQELIGCASMHSYNRNSCLANLFIGRKWRNRGLGSYLLKYLVDLSANSSKTAYSKVDLSSKTASAKTASAKSVSLVCKPKLVEFYANYGFKKVAWTEISPNLKRIYKSLSPHPKFFGFPLVLMEYKLMEYQNAT